jgi:hypothetical protein
MDRRAFLLSLPALAGMGRSYFDMGAAWQQHDSGLYLCGYPIVWIDGTDISEHVQSIELNYDPDRIGGLKEWTLELHGVWDT